MVRVADLHYWLSITREKENFSLRFLCAVCWCQAIIVRLLVRAVLIISSQSKISWETGQLCSLKWSDIITVAGPENSISFAILPLTEGWRSGPDRNGRLVSGNDMESKGNRGHLQSHLSIPATPSHHSAAYSATHSFCHWWKITGNSITLPRCQRWRATAGEKVINVTLFGSGRAFSSLCHNTMFNRKK